MDLMAYRDKGADSGLSGSSVCPTDCRHSATDLLSAILAFFCDYREGRGQVRFSGATICQSENQMG